MPKFNVYLSEGQLSAALLDFIGRAFDDRKFSQYVREGLEFVMAYQSRDAAALSSSFPHLASMFAASPSPAPSSPVDPPAPRSIKAVSVEAPVFDDDDDLLGSIEVRSAAPDMEAGRRASENLINTLLSL